MNDIFKDATNSTTRPAFKEFPNSNLNDQFGTIRNKINESLSGGKPTEEEESDVLLYNRQQSDTAENILALGRPKTKEEVFEQNPYTPVPELNEYQQKRYNEEKTTAEKALEEINAMPDKDEYIKNNKLLYDSYVKDANKTEAQYKLKETAYPSPIRKSFEEMTPEEQSQIQYAQGSAGGTFFNDMRQSFQDSYFENMADEKYLANEKIRYDTERQDATNAIYIGEYGAKNNFIGLTLWEKFKTMFHTGSDLTEEEYNKYYVDGIQPFEEGINKNAFIRMSEAKKVINEISKTNPELVKKLRAEIVGDGAFGIPSKKTMIGILSDIGIGVGSMVVPGGQALLLSGYIGLYASQNGDIFGRMVGDYINSAFRSLFTIGQQDSVVAKVAVASKMEKEEMDKLIKNTGELATTAGLVGAGSWLAKQGLNVAKLPGLPAKALGMAITAVGAGMHIAAWETKGGISDKISEALIKDDPNMGHIGEYEVMQGAISHSLGMTAPNRATELVDEVLTGTAMAVVLGGVITGAVKGIKGVPAVVNKVSDKISNLKDTNAGRKQAVDPIDYTSMTDVEKKSMQDNISNENYTAVADAAKLHDLQQKLAGNVTKIETDTLIDQARNMVNKTDDSNILPPIEDVILTSGQNKSYEITQNKENNISLPIYENLPNGQTRHLVYETRTIPFMISNLDKNKFQTFLSQTKGKTATRLNESLNKRNKDKIANYLQDIKSGEIFDREVLKEKDQFIKDTEALQTNKTEISQNIEKTSKETENITRQISDLESKNIKIDKAIEKYNSDVIVGKKTRQKLADIDTMIKDGELIKKQVKDLNKELKEKNKTLKELPTNLKKVEAEIELQKYKPYSLVEDKDFLDMMFISDQKAFEMMNLLTSDKDAYKMYREIAHKIGKELAEHEVMTVRPSKANGDYLKALEKKHNISELSEKMDLLANDVLKTKAKEDILEASQLVKNLLQAEQDLHLFKAVQSELPKSEVEKLLGKTEKSIMENIDNSKKKIDNYVESKAKEQEKIQKEIDEHLEKAEKKEIEENKKVDNEMEELNSKIEEHTKAYDECLAGASKTNKPSNIDI